MEDGLSHPPKSARTMQVAKVCWLSVALAPSKALKVMAPDREKRTGRRKRRRLVRVGSLARADAPAWGERAVGRVGVSSVVSPGV